MSDEDRMEIWVNGRSVRIYRGMQVKHALIALDQELYRQASRGELTVEDENGFVLGLEGSLHPGGKIVTRTCPRIP